VRIALFAAVALPSCSSSGICRLTEPWANPVESVSLPAVPEGVVLALRATGTGGGQTFSGSVLGATASDGSWYFGEFPLDHSSGDTGVGGTIAPCNDVPVVSGEIWLDAEDATYDPDDAYPPLPFVLDNADDGIEVELWDGTPLNIDWGRLIS
jgi:hypothetical protein